MSLEDWTPEMWAECEERTRIECEEQGLPLTIDDPVLLAKTARLLESSDRLRALAQRAEKAA